ncbi:polyprenyl synthetase family protein, partial [candidate division KSB1 bacterium]|nr:polyprenyl synthetase family protein [candidate division KSB1 bacterium]
KPTVNNLWDNRISVLVGDLLFSRTLTAVLSLKDQDALAILEETANRITEGELLQIECGQDFAINETTYLDLISKKTATLFSASCELGAIAVSDDAACRRRMRDFGENLGIAFQIKDDLLDYIGDAKKLGKPIGNDIRENKITLPLIYALSRAEQGKKDEIYRILEKENMTVTQAQSVVHFVQDMGGLEYAQGMADSYAQKASTILNAYPESQKLDVFKQLVQFAIEREN